MVELFLHGSELLLLLSELLLEEDVLDLGLAVDLVGELVDSVLKGLLLLFGGDVEHVDLVTGLVHGGDLLDQLFLFGHHL